MLEPSANHGVTTVVVGSCGIGFAPARPEHHALLIETMEYVEDVPGAVLEAAMPWAWETFPEFLDFLEAGVKNAPEGNPFAEALRDVVKR